ncbi:hypothetical protein D0B54_01650 [Solimonas sp. K1W22B-7]|nr:hypothetical protein D0B54_01650 [Solimonas sp. K1W22B-7]
MRIGVEAFERELPGTLRKQLAKRGVRSVPLIGWLTPLVFGGGAVAISSFECETSAVDFCPLSRLRERDKGRGFL